MCINVFLYLKPKPHEVLQYLAVTTCSQPCWILRLHAMWRSQTVLALTWRSTDRISTPGISKSCYFDLTSPRRHKTVSCVVTDSHSESEDKLSLLAISEWILNLYNKVKWKSGRFIQTEESAILFDHPTLSLLTSLCCLVCSLHHVLSSHNSLNNIEHVKLCDLLSACRQKIWGHATHWDFNHTMKLHQWEYYMAKTLDSHSKQRRMVILVLCLCVPQTCIQKGLL